MVWGNVPKVAALLLMNVARVVLSPYLTTLLKEVAMSTVIDFASHRLMQKRYRETKARRLAGFGFLAKSFPN